MTNLYSVEGANIVIPTDSVATGEDAIHRQDIVIDEGYAKIVTINGEDGTVRVFSGGGVVDERYEPKEALMLGIALILAAYSQGALDA